MTQIMDRRLRLGMVGGGMGAFIGGVHRIASRIDDEFELVAGAFSSDPERSRISGAQLGVSAERSYGSFAEMAIAEAARADGIDVVAIVTPNHMHFSAAKAFLEAGINVICDKPLTSTLEDALALGQVQPKNGAKFLLTHNYTGYPLVRQARKMLDQGLLGSLRVVQVEYPQDWLTQDVSSKQADWRVDPARSGAGGCIGDIGTHAYNLLRFVTGLELDVLSADLQSFVPGRRVDDNVHIMLRFKGGARGMLWASQVAPGHENGLKLRVYGEKGSIEWVQANPNEMWFSPFGAPKQLLTRGGATLVEFSNDDIATRIPAGHPEGFLEAFATLYSEFAKVIRTGELNTNLPGLGDGIEGLRFISAAIASSKNDAAWTALA